MAVFGMDTPAQEAVAFQNRTAHIGSLKSQKIALATFETDDSCE